MGKKKRRQEGWQKGQENIMIIREEKMEVSTIVVAETERREQTWRKQELWSLVPGSEKRILEEEVKSKGTSYRQFSTCDYMYKWTIEM